MKNYFPTIGLDLEFSNSINSIVMSPISQTKYQLLSTKPEWLELLGDCLSKQQFVLNQSDSCLGSFLVNAKKHWSSNTLDTIRSEQWIQADANGTRYTFEAMADTLKDQPILLIRCLTEHDLENKHLAKSLLDSLASQRTIDPPLYRDDLTGLYDRLGFFHHAEEQLLVARCHQQPVTVASIDLDRLKLVNQKYGYKTGNQIIATAATLFKKAFRKSDILGYLGEDKFLAVLPNLESAKAVSISERLNRTINDWNVQQEPDSQISFSIGFTSDDDELHPLVQMVKQADMNRHKHKQSKYLNS